MANLPSNWSDFMRVVLSKSTINSLGLCPGLETIQVEELASTGLSGALHVLQLLFGPARFFAWAGWDSQRLWSSSLPSFAWIA